MKKYTPELGQAAFGQPFKEYEVSELFYAALRSISNEWDRVMWNIHQKCLDNPFSNSGQKWKCDTFEVESYSWDFDKEQEYNFKWNDIKVSWYKYLGRGMSVNVDISLKQIDELLKDCLDALRKLEKENGCRVWDSV